jgi:hypothetical protein
MTTERKSIRGLIESEIKLQSVDGRFPRVMIDQLVAAIEVEGVEIDDIGAMCAIKGLCAAVGMYDLAERDRKPTAPEGVPLTARDLVETDPEHVFTDRDR